MRVVVVGSGGVAEIVAREIVRRAPQSLVQVYGRNRQRIKELSAEFGLDVSGQLQPADLYVIAVSDDAIPCLAEQLPFAAGSVVCHTAGAVAMDALRNSAGAKIGVLYPLQSFTRGRNIELDEVPLFVEGEDEATTNLIESFAGRLSQRVVRMDSAQRRKLHLAAVFVSNFTNAMLSASSEIIDEANLGIDLYRPLIAETIDKALASGDPRSVQTGPARRGDQQTMEHHLELLSGRDNLIEIYKSISKYIWETSKRI